MRALPGVEVDSGETIELLEQLRQLLQVPSVETGHAHREGEGLVEHADRVELLEVVGRERRHAGALVHG